MPHCSDTVVRAFPAASASVINISKRDALAYRAPDYRSLIQLRETLRGLRDLLAADTCAKTDSCTEAMSSASNCEATRQLLRTGGEIDGAISSLDAVLESHPETTDLPGELPIMHFVNLFVPDRSLLRIFTRAHTWEVELPVPFPALNGLEQPEVRQLALHRLRASGAPEEILALFSAT